MYDQANDIIFDPKAVDEYSSPSDIPAEAQQPGCLVAGTNAETYQGFNRTTRQYTNFAAMTICNGRLSQPYTSMIDVIEEGKIIYLGNPGIDNYALLPQTILHEVNYPELVFRPSRWRLTPDR
jgi:hypothetical protein